MPYTTEREITISIGVSLVYIKGIIYIECSNGELKKWKIQERYYNEKRVIERMDPFAPTDELVFAENVYKMANPIVSLFSNSDENNIPLFAIDDHSNNSGKIHHLTV